MCIRDSFNGAKKEVLKHDDIMPVVMACLSMGKQKVGALIVIEHNVPLDEIFILKYYSTNIKYLLALF